MNGQGQLQCQQDPKDVTRVGSVKELPLHREKPIFHEPVGTLIKDKEQLTAMYLNSFDRIGSLKGEYTIKIDPSVAPVQQARCKVPIESKEAICAALDSMIAGDILESQIEPTPWVNNATYPVKPTEEVKTLPGLHTIEQGHYQRESHPANGGGNCPRTGRSKILHERRRLQSLLARASL